MTRVLLIMGPAPGLRRVSEVSDAELRDRHPMAARAELGRGKHVRTPDGRITVDLLAFYDAMQAFGSATVATGPGGAR